MNSTTNFTKKSTFIRITTLLLLLLGSAPLIALSPEEANTDIKLWSKTDKGLFIDLAETAPSTDNTAETALEIETVLMSEQLYPVFDIENKTYNSSSGWGNFTVGTDPTSNYGTIPVGLTQKIHCKEIKLGVKC